MATNVKMGLVDKPMVSEERNCHWHAVPETTDSSDMLNQIAIRNCLMKCYVMCS